MKFYAFILSVAILFTSCSKNEEEAPKSVLPPSVQGQWLRGSFDLKAFWSYTGTTVQAPATTDGLQFHADGTVESYTVFFPTDPHQGCTPQKLLYKKGVARFNETNKTFTLEFTEGQYREFYQGCAGKVNVTKTLTAAELNLMTLSGFWKVEQDGGQTLFGIAYASTGGPYLYLGKSSW